MPTYYERSVRQAPEVWRSLRRRRASPPAAANSPDRGATFRSALEQAEQQFRAASFVDYDSRALNVFYGLSQAGRAVAAASRALHGNDWILQGHGLKAVNLAKASSDITVISVEPFRPNQGPSGSFTRLSQVLNSPLPSSVGLGELWPLMYETTFLAPLGDVSHPPLEVQLSERLHSGAHGLDTAYLALPAALADVPVNERPLLGEFLSYYPALSGWRTETTLGTPVTWPPEGQQLNLQWELTAAEAQEGHILDPRLTRYRRHSLVIPATAGQRAALHPLMAWWGVLYALSMMTRYQPAEWTTLIDVNRTEQATAIEFVLDTALDAAPDLVDEAIDLVA